MYNEFREGCDFVKKQKIIMGVIIGVIVVMIGVVLVLIMTEKQHITYHDASDDGTFSTSFIRESHLNTEQKNYMISPYSVELALSMLREGTAGEAREEIESVAPKRNIKTLSVYKKVNVANALFVKDIYKNDVLDSYYQTIKEDYNAEVLYDPFTSPDKINQWVNKETNGMIKKVINDIDPDFVLALANAVAMEEEWRYPFACEMTTNHTFTKANGKKYEVAMMFGDYEEGVSYYESEDAIGVTLPYRIYDRETGKEAEEEGEQLDFIGLIPEDIDEYLKEFDMDTVKDIAENSEAAGHSLEISVGLPRFEYSYDFGKFKKTLMDMGIKNVFSPGTDLSNLLEGHPDAYVNDAVHKSYVKVDEVGTKAAAVTYFGIKDSAMPMEEKRYVSVIFEKPFIFMIKDHNSNEILFFGVVYEPEKWDSSKTCK